MLSIVREKGAFIASWVSFFPVELNLILCSILCVELFHVTLCMLNRGIAAILVYSIRGSQSLQKLVHVAISQRSWRPLLTLRAGYIGNNGKNWLLYPWTSSQSEGYSSKWLIWLVCREPLSMEFACVPPHKAIEAFLC